MMNVTQTICLPTEDTLEQLKGIFSTCPFAINFDSFYVELNTCKADQVVRVEPNRIFEALPVQIEGNRFKGLVKAYDPYLSRTSLYLPLTSPELYSYALNLRKENGTMFHPIPLLYINIVPYYHNRSNYNIFVNSISDFFVNAQPVLTFSGMMIRSLDLDYANDIGYYDVNNCV